MSSGRAAGPGAQDLGGAGARTRSRPAPPQRLQHPTAVAVALARTRERRLHLPRYAQVRAVHPVAHIHEAATGPNGPPLITLTKTANEGFEAPAGAKLTDAQYASFLAGKLYINVHSAAHPNCEIRSPLLPTAATPKK